MSTCRSFSIFIGSSLFFLIMGSGCIAGPKLMVTEFKNFVIFQKFNNQTGNWSPSIETIEYLHPRVINILANDEKFGGMNIGKDDFIVQYVDGSSEGNNFIFINGACGKIKPYYETIWKKELVYFSEGCRFQAKYYPDKDEIVELFIVTGQHGLE